MKIIPEIIEDYCEAHSSCEPDYLKKLSRATHLRSMYPQMLSGTLQGRLLSFISKLIKPRYVLEIGTFTGYSALCLAEGLREDGLLFTLEADPELEDIILEHWRLSPYESRLKLVLGEALTTIPTLPVHQFDLIFLDADKENYPRYYFLLRNMLRPGGVMLADNVLWSGKVTDSACTDRETEALREFNRLVAEDDSVEKVMLPIRDGLTLVRRKS
jgi:predicted O-methyltransferase YrrM